MNIIGRALNLLDEVVNGEELVRSSVWDFAYVPHFLVAFFIIEMTLYYVILEIVLRISLRFFHEKGWYEANPDRILQFKRRGFLFFQHSFVYMYTTHFFSGCDWWYPNQAVVLPPDIYAKREYNMSVRFIVVEVVSYYVYKQIKLFIMTYQGTQPNNYIVMSVHHIATLFLIGFAYISVISGVPVILLVIGGNPSEPIYDFGRLTMDLRISIGPFVSSLPIVYTWFYYRCWRYAILLYGFILRVKERYVQERSWRLDECMLPVIFSFLLYLQFWWWYNITSYVVTRIYGFIVGKSKGSKMRPKNVCLDDSDVKKDE